MIVNLLFSNLCENKKFILYVFETLFDIVGMNYELINLSAWKSKVKNNRITIIYAPLSEKNIYSKRYPIIFIPMKQHVITKFMEGKTDSFNEFFSVFDKINRSIRTNEKLELFKINKNHNTIQFDCDFVAILRRFLN